MLCLFQYLYTNCREVSTQICIGTKVLSLKSGNLTFKDSLCFLPFSLAFFSSTFDIKEHKKGFFPHLFNTMENQGYEGPIPDSRFYDPDGMSEDKKKEFLRWYEEQKRLEWTEGYVFHLRHEMEQYCISDVKLLMAGCQKFQSEFAIHAGIGIVLIVKKMIKCTKRVALFPRKLITITRQ